MSLAKIQNKFFYSSISGLYFNNDMGGAPQGGKQQNAPGES